MSRATLVWLLIACGAAVLFYVIYAHRNSQNGPELSEAVSVVIALIGLGGAGRIFYLVFIEQPEPLGNDDLVCMFVGAMALAWCSVKEIAKPFRNSKASAD